MQIACLGMSVLSLASVFSVADTAEKGGKLLIGWASEDITPENPVALAGQFHVRISKYVNDPLTATALAIESADENNANEQAIMVSCDILGIEQEIQNRLREMVKPKLPEFDTRKLFLNGTHTHTGPVMSEGRYPEQGEEVTTPTEYVNFLLNRLSDVVVAAWESREAGGVSWALSHAVVGHNRRAVYSDGSATMYGSTDRADFSHIEGYEDHSVNLLFFWNQENELTGIVINIACTSQVTEGEYYVSADFWHEVRTELRKRYSESLFVLPQSSAAGDQSPHFLLSGKAEENMRRRKGVSEREEIAIRIADAVDYVFSGARSDMQTAARLEHMVEDLGLPVRKVTEAELERAKSEYDRLMAKQPLDENSSDRSHLRRNKSLIDRYERQEEASFYQMELHVIRLGDIAIATNPFELFLDYGIRIKARSKALQTFVVQLACASGGYLPTARGVAGGGYGAEIASNRVGPEGGQVLVDRIVELISEMWDNEDR
ncbi:hypothetical protein ACFL6S_10010 [Candidatus Poribacteria bacterium]